MALARNIEEGHMSRKVRTERAYVDLLIRSTPSLYKVVPQKSEAPDFLFNLKGKTVGIEVTELNVPSRRLPHRNRWKAWRILLPPMQES